MQIKSKIIILLSLFISISAFASSNIIKNADIHQLWQFKTDAKPGKTLIDRDGNVYVISKNQTSARLYAIDANGKEKWHLNLANQDYAAPAIDIEGNINVYGKDMALFSVSANGTIKWRIQLPNLKDETGNTDIPLTSGQYTSFIYATTSQGRIFILPYGKIGRIYTPLFKGPLVAPPVEWIYTDGGVIISFALNRDEKQLGDIAEIHTLTSSNKHGIEDKTIELKGTISYFSAGAYTKLIYIVLKQHEKKSLMLFQSNGSNIWSRPIANENIKLIQQEDSLENFQKIYYSDTEDNQNVILGIDIRGKVIFKTYLNTDAIENILSYKNKLITINQSNSGIQNISVFDKSSTKLLCESEPLNFTSLQSNNQTNKVYLSSAFAVSAFQTCATG